MITTNDSPGLSHSAWGPWFLAISPLMLAAGIIPAYYPPRLPAQSVSTRNTLRVAAWQHVEDFRQPLAQFESVFWEPRDTDSLRQLIRDTALVRGKTILEIGTGTGLVALCCLQSGADKVVATDVNPAALANARWNAESLGLSERLDARLVPLDDPEAYQVIGSNEQFDLIISNPPWENQKPITIEEFALYDLDFKLLQSIVHEAPQHLKADGKLLLAYGSRDAIVRIPELAREQGFEIVVHDNRSLEDLPAVFLPGMLIELRHR